MPCSTTADSHRLPAETAPADASPPDSAADALLVAASARGDADAFRLLVESHSPALLRFCSRLLECPEEARDVCQDTFVRVWCAMRDGYREQGRFRAWLWRIALNLCRDRRKAGRIRLRHAAAARDESDPQATGGSPADDAARRADLRKLARGLDALPESLRLPLWLCSVEELTQAECAAALDLSVRSVEGRIHRARRRLAAWWDRQPDA